MMEKKEEMKEIYIDDTIKELKEFKNEIAQKILSKKQLGTVEDFVSRLELFELFNLVTEEDRKIKEVSENDKEWRELKEKIEQLLNKAKRLKKEGKKIARIPINLL